MQQALFYCFAILSIVSAVMVISLSNAVHSVLSLVLTFFSVSCLWMLLEAEFLAITLVLVYVGAVMVLFLFVVMMLDLNQGQRLDKSLRHIWIYAGFGLLTCVAGVLTVYSGPFNAFEMPMPPPHTPEYSNLQALGEALFGQYLLPFELAGLILLLAIVAAIALTFEPRVRRKQQDPNRQVQVGKQDRLRLYD